MSVKELKEELHLSGADTLNVFFASNSVREELAGAATWPWAKEALTHQGEGGGRVLITHLNIIFTSFWIVFLILMLHHLKKRIKYIISIKYINKE